MSFENGLYQKISKIIKNWKPDNGYAVSFFLNMNLIDGNMPHLKISYNTETDCNNASMDSVERWNYAFWAQNEFAIIDSKNEISECIKWLNSQGIANVGAEIEGQYDETFNYVGTGPAGYRELAELLSEVAIKIRKDGLIKEIFGKEVPVIIHGLEYFDFIFDLAKRTNPLELVQPFLDVMAGSADLKITISDFSQSDIVSNNADDLLKKIETKLGEIGPVDDDIKKMESIIDILGLNDTDKNKLMKSLKKATELSKILK